jgi:hypothetical protein
MAEMVAEIQPVHTDRETLAEIETHRRELKATYDAITDVLRAVEDLQIKAGIELSRWDRKVARALQDSMCGVPQQQKQLEVLIEERDSDPDYIYAPAGGWSR